MGASCSSTGGPPGAEVTASRAEAISPGIPLPPPARGVNRILRKASSIAPEEGRLAAAGSLLNFAGNGSAPYMQPFNAPPAPPIPQLVYYGGRVISNVQIVQVNWSPPGSVFQTQITDGEMAGFYSGVVNSTFFDWLSEYNTQSVFSALGQTSSQRIGRNVFSTPIVTITNPAITGASLTDAQIQTELATRIQNGQLPAPTLDAAGNINTIYFVHFPQGTSINLNGAFSCAQYCAYHGTIAQPPDAGAGGPDGGSPDLGYYAVMPDMSPGSGCDICFTGVTPFQNLTIIASHELAEAVTDPEVGRSPSSIAYTDAGVALLFPIAWYDANLVDIFNGEGGEIGDICRSQSPPANVIDATGNAWYVQRLWSNAMGECMASHLANGGLELGDLTAWTPLGSAAVGSASAGTPTHSGLYALKLGSSTAATARSSVSQTLDLPDPDPAGTIQLTFWYQQTCPNSSLGWGTVQVVDTATQNYALVPTEYCNGASSLSPWHQLSFDVTPYHGHTVMLSLGNWDDPTSMARSYAILDDINTIRTPAPTQCAVAPVAGCNPIVNPSFETWGTPGWTSTGITSVYTYKIEPVVTGRHSAVTGGPFGGTSGDSSLAQTFTVPALESTLRLHVFPVCRGTLSTTWVSVTLADVTPSGDSGVIDAGAPVQILPNSCTNTQTWTTLAAPVVAGHTYTLTMTSHDNGSSATYAVWDDITVQ
jgi:hypothetical protein